MYILRLLILIALHVAFSCHLVNAIECDYKSEFPTADGSKCAQMPCRNSAYCQNNYTKYCPQGTEMHCLELDISISGQGICSCRGQWSGDRYGNSGSCNRSLNGNDKCKNKGQICSPTGKCINDPHCSFLGESCETQGCCKGFCNGIGSGTKTCTSTVPPGGPCGGETPCEPDSTCMNGVCSLPVNGACTGSSIPCPPQTECLEAGYMGNVYEICACKKGVQGESC